MSDHNPFVAPENQGVPAKPSGSNREHLIKVATAQRHVLFVILAYLALLPFNIAAQQVPQLAVILLPVAIIVFIAGAITVFRLASLFRGKAVAVLYLIGLLIPCLGLILLLVISSEATNLLKSNGIKVGLLGANPNDI